MSASSASSRLRLVDFGIAVMLSQANAESIPPAGTLAYMAPEQIHGAAIAYLLPALYHQARRYTGSLWILLAELRSTLFQRPAIETTLYRRRRQALAEMAARQPALSP